MNIAVPDRETLLAIQAEIAKSKADRADKKSGGSGQKGDTRFIDMKLGTNKFFVVPDPAGELARKSYQHYALGKNFRESVPCPCYTHPKLNLSCPVCFALKEIRSEKPHLDKEIRRRWSTARTMLNVVPVMIGDELWTGEALCHLLRAPASLYEFVYERAVDPDYNFEGDKELFVFDPEHSHALKIKKTQSDPDEPMTTEYSYDLVPRRAAIVPTDEEMEAVAKSRFTLMKWVGYKKDFYDKGISLANQLIQSFGGNPIPVENFPPYISVEEASARHSAASTSAAAPEVATQTVVASEPVPAALETATTPVPAFVRDYEKINPTTRKPTCFGHQDSKDSKCNECPYEDACMLETKKNR